MDSPLDSTCTVGWSDNIIYIFVNEDIHKLTVCYKSIEYCEMKIYIYITYNENFLKIHDTLYVENICIYLLFINNVYRIFTYLKW